MVAVLSGSGAQGGGVGAGVGLGQAVAAEVFHGDELREVLGLLFVIAELVDHPRDHVVDGDIGGDGWASGRHRFEDQGRIHPAHSGSAGLFADVDAAHPEVGGPLDDVDGEEVLGVPFEGVRGDFRIGELAHHPGDGLLFVGETER